MRGMPQSQEKPQRDDGKKSNHARRMPAEMVSPQSPGDARQDYHDCVLRLNPSRIADLQQPLRTRVNVQFAKRRATSVRRSRSLNMSLPERSNGTHLQTQRSSALRRSAWTPAILG